MMRLKPLRGIIYLFIIALLLTGCGKKIVLDFEPNGNLIAYKQTAYTLKAKKTFVIKLNNVATVPVMIHNVVLLKPGTDVNAFGLKAQTAPNHLPDDPNIIAATALAKPGELVEIEVKGLAPGNYPFVCTYPGHFMLMQGVITVE